MKNSKFQIPNSKLRGQAPHLRSTATPSRFSHEETFIPKLDFSGITLPYKGRCEKRSASKVSGQAMLLTIVLLSGSILAASSIAGYLMLLQIRGSSDTTNSTKAIFAADSGIEWGLYTTLKNPSYVKPSFTNGADFEVTINSSTIKSIGQANNVFRAFEANLAGATSTLP